MADRQSPSSSANTETSSQVVVDSGSITRAACSDIAEAMVLFEMNGQSEVGRTLVMEHLTDFGSPQMSEDGRIALVCTGCSEHAAATSGT